MSRIRATAWLASLIAGPRRAAAIMLAAALAVATPGDAPAQPAWDAVAAAGPAADAASAAGRATDWTRVLKAAEAYAAAGQAAPKETELYLELLDDLVRKAGAAKSDAEKTIQETTPLLNALGPAPNAESGETEPEDVADLRRGYNVALDQARSRVAAADIATVRAEQLRGEIAGLSRQELAEQLNRRTDDPWRLAALAAGVREVGAALAEAALAPAKWRASLSDAAWEEFRQNRLPILAAVIALATLLGFAMRRILKARFVFARDEDGRVTQARRLGVAVARALADGVIPAAVLAVVYIWFERELAGFGTPLLADVIAGAALGLALAALAYAGLSAAFAPDGPEARLVPVGDEAAHAIRRRAMLFAGVAAVDLFIWTALASMAKSPQFLTVYAMAACGARALALLPLLSGSLWRPETPAGPAEPDGTEASDASRFWLIGRIVVGVAALGAVVDAALGYAELALFVSRALSWTLVTVGGVFLLRGAAREAIEAAFDSGVVRRWLNIGDDGADTLTFWGRLLLEPVFLIAAAVLTAPYWGFTQREMLTWAGGVLSGFKIGEVSISPAEIGLAILAVALVLIATRTTQSALLTRLLPRTRMDPGVQNSLAQAFGYLGMILALAVGVSALGVDLSNLAIVAGALSVGIGFGLQSVVNNFVSGLILLAERPVKVGDWVIVGDQQGIVKRIAIRATEIETFDRSSVIIPNSDLISNRVINRTHKDRYGRIDIAIGVAYGSDTHKVEDLLLEIGRAHPEVMRLPEPFVLFMGFGASSLDFELRVFTANNLRSFVIASAIRHTIAERFAEEGVEIPFPQRVVHMVPPPAPPSVAD